MEEQSFEDILSGVLHGRIPGFICANFQHSFAHA